MNTTQLPEAAVSALMNGRKVEAVKIVRAENQLGLKEAHDLVNQYILENPAIQESLNQHNGDGFLRLLAIAIIIGIVVYLFLGNPV